MQQMNGLNPNLLMKQTRSSSNPKDKMKQLRQNGSVLIPNTQASPLLSSENGDHVMPLATIKDEEESVSNVSQSTKRRNSRRLSIKNSPSMTKTFDLKDQSENFRLPDLPKSTKNSSKKVKFSPIFCSNLLIFLHRFLRMMGRMKDQFTIGQVGQIQPPLP